MTTTINKQVSSDRLTFTGGVLNDSLTPIVVDDMGLDSSWSSLRACGVLIVRSKSPVPSNITIEIVDNNTQIEKEVTNGPNTFSPYELVTAQIMEGEELSGKDQAEKTITLVNGLANLSIKINSNDPVLTDDLTVTYKVFALAAS